MRNRSASAVIRIFMMAIFLSLTLSSGASGGVIYQGFNQRFVTLTDRMQRLAELGYRYVQVSPPQKSIDDPIWWGRYQPVDFRVIEGPLGNEGEFKRMIERAHDHGLQVIVDVVFNHMADPVFYPAALNYPQFTWWDFNYHATRPCITDFSDRHQVTKFWLCDPAFPGRALPDLDTSSSYVRRVHKEFLSKLLALGVDGFRFDAAKHIEPEYFDDVLTAIPYGKFFYGEVIGQSLYESQLYTPKMKVTDFHLLGAMINAFSFGGSMEELVHPEAFGQALPGADAVVFARNHDTAMHPTFFNFATHQDAVLASAYLLARGVGIPMIYRDDYRDETIAAGIRFYNYNEGAPTFVRKASEVCGDHQGCSNQVMLVIERGDQAFAVINKASDWIDVPTAKLSGVRSGCYKEVHHGTVALVARGGDGERWIALWGVRSRGGLAIGPRSALYFLPTDGRDCATLR